MQTNRDPLRVYISGPITGKPNLNKDAFENEERLLKESGYSTFNPHSIAGPSDEVWLEWNQLAEDERKKKIWQYYMRVCVGQIPLCDEMRMLPHWQNSHGSRLGHQIARELGLKITYCHVPDEDPKW